MINGKRYYILGITLLSTTFIILMLVLVCNFDNNKELSKTKNESSISKKQFGMYVADENGEYVEYIGNELFPYSSMYTFNEEKSYCVDNKDNVVNDVINYVNGKVTVTSNKTLYCYLYFDRDNVVPTIIVTVINNNTLIPKLEIASNESGIYCVNTISSEMNSCIFEGAINANATITTEIINETNIYYVHVKDAANNVGRSEGISVTKGNPLGTYLLENPTSGLNTTLDGGLYRYQGTKDNVDNYICFGTSDKNTCLGNTDAYMYRIIGINSSKHVKLLKNEALNSQFYWDTSTSANNAWPNSTLFNKLNGSSFLTNVTYMPSDWSDKIADYLWKCGDISTFKDTAVNIYNIESGWSNQVSSKIGLIYLHDYYYAYQSGGLACGSNTTTCKQSWMNMSNCDSNPPSIDEWYISHYNSNKAYFMNTSGGIGYDSVGCYLSARPVFYLKSNIQYVSGTGKSSDPFIIGFGVPSDTSAPTVTASAVSNNSSSPKISIISNEAGTYCVNTQSTPTNFSNCALTGSISANTSITTSTLSTSGTYYVHVKDSVGNIGISNMVSIFISTTGDTIGNYILENPTRGLNTTLEGGLYRYQGTNDTVNNYICFGTSDKNDCITDEEHHMYRIIGGTEDGRVKVIKKTSIGEFQWWTDKTTNVPWYSETGNRSLLYTTLNGSDFLGNTSYVPSGWEDLIADTSWKYGDITSANMTAASVYNIENVWTNTVSAKIGLIYLHDYYYSQQPGGKNCSSAQETEIYSTCTYGWMYLKQNDTDLPSDNLNTYHPSSEFTMSRYGFLSTDFRAWSVFKDGSVVLSALPIANSVRPVFYLKSSVEYISGTGTTTDPFIIS